ncbi:nucleotide pyrophosphohydrolase [Myroides odoratimimus]|uniref:nucleotide pyrophosphohydrolase n=1 Tax=Myroides odoratimimus TaxID=76832 RepID=UPI001CE0E247|nr:nucleotide pyrophosphohydrolase [Myroides odoratimimus]MCA4793912.1 nucleotide pyrophosphohydrolase [Myroides odoratimimus]MCA4821188.1 nucleotide pyrophosphohydrolase [Myroides odoratimimus]MDM1504205.1 nucleotide pyrophosphohydrolase [Myroides odoratimimus]
MLKTNKHITSSKNENLPQNFIVRFEEYNCLNYPQVKVTLDNIQVGDTIDDNSYTHDGYRYHDIFHFTFAAILDWSPCTRSMMRRKRKSNLDIDRIEDGARAAITEECISLMIFSRAKNKEFFKNIDDIDLDLLFIIKEMTTPFEVESKTIDDWKNAIYEAYRVFRQLLLYKGGQVLFDTTNKTIKFEKLN